MSPVTRQNHLKNISRAGILNAAPALQPRSHKPNLDDARSTHGIEHCTKRAEIYCNFSGYSLSNRRAVRNRDVLESCYVQETHTDCDVVWYALKPNANNSYALFVSFTVNASHKRLVDQSQYCRTGNY